LTSEPDVPFCDGVVEGFVQLFKGNIALGHVTGGVLKARSLQGLVRSFKRFFK
jgi:hypothetical protein